MSSVRQTGTKAELAVRMVLDDLGIEYTVGERRLPGSPDIMLNESERPVFVHGCFWHRHRGCRLASTPKSNSVYWSSKFADNLRRDKAVLKALKALGLSPIVVWQCELKDPAKLRRRLRRAAPMKNQRGP